MKHLRRLIREELSRLLSESMTMGIEGFKYEHDLDHVLDICHYIISKVANQLWPQLVLSSEEQERIGGIGDTFTPDGNDALEVTGTINFYCLAFPVRTLEKILSYIKYILAEKDIQLGPFKYEKVSDKLTPEEMKEWGGDPESLRVIRIPVVKNDSGDSGNPPVINLANNNARKLFHDVLGFENEDGYYFSVAELLMKISSARKQVESRSDIPEQDQNVCKGNFCSTINGKRYYRDMFDRLEKFCSWANTRGYSQLYLA